MSETIKPTDQINEQPAYDEHLYGAFLENGSLQAYEYLSGDRDFRNEQKRQFLAGEISNPQLDYPDINPEMIDKTESALLSMKQDIISNEQNEVVRQAYRWRLNEKIAEIRMLKSTAANDMRRFKRYSEFIYGKPSTDVFAYTVNSIISEANQFTDSDNSDTSRAAIDLLQSLPVMDQPEIPELPNAETIGFAHKQTEKELGDLIDIPSEATKLDASQIQEAFETALSRTGDNGWRVEIDEKSSKTAVSVDQEQMQVNIPQSRTVTRAKLAGLIVHEIGTHVARRTNGERSSLKLLGLGLDRYETGEEGIATMREQALANKMDDFRGIDGLLAIGLSLGLDGQPRDFRQVYTVLEKYYLFKNLKSKKDLLEAHEKAQTSAWNHSIRTFRGTDCKTPGVCFTKDIVYRNGNIGIWDVVRNNPEEMLRFNIGKYDPTNSRHLWILEQLGITDQDLTELEL
jgi:hypothetical protein